MQIFIKKDNGKDSAELTRYKELLQSHFHSHNRRHQIHSPKEISEQRKYKVLTSMVPAAADGPMLPSRLGSGGGKKTGGV